MFGKDSSDICLAKFQVTLLAKNQVTSLAMNQVSWCPVLWKVYMSGKMSHDVLGRKKSVKQSVIQSVKHNVGQNAVQHVW